MGARPKHIFLVGSLFFLTAIFILTRKKEIISPSKEKLRGWSVNQSLQPNTHGEQRSVIHEQVEREDSHGTPFLNKGKNRLILTAEQLTLLNANAASNRNNVGMAVGILVAKRERPTIYYLLEHLLSEPRVTEDFVIIVHVAYSVSQDEELLEYLRRLKDVVTIVEEKPHPEAMEENINDTRGDSMERTVWRTTHGEAISRLHEAACLEVDKHCMSCSLYSWTSCVELMLYSVLYV